MPLKAPPPLAGLRVSLREDISLGTERYAKPLEKICDALDPLLQGKTKEALGLNAYSLHGRVVTMKEQLRSLENSFADEIRIQKDARDSEAKTFAMARAAHVEHMEKMRQLAVEQAQARQVVHPTEQELQIARLTEQLEQKQLEHRSVKDDLEKLLMGEVQRSANKEAELQTIKLALVAAERKVGGLSSKLEDQAKKERRLQEQLEQKQRELDATMKMYEQEQDSRRRDADRFEKAREAWKSKAKETEARISGAVDLSGATLQHMDLLSQRAERAEAALNQSAEELRLLKQEVERTCGPDILAEVKSVRQASTDTGGHSEPAVASAPVKFERTDAAGLPVQSDLQASLDTEEVLQSELEKIKVSTGTRHPHRVRTATTVTTQVARAGTTTITVGDVSGIIPGMAITISTGTNSETKSVADISSPGIVKLDSALQSNYLAGADVKAQVKIASTVTTQDVRAGAAIITVADVSGFLTGMSITISNDTSSETKSVVGVWSPGIVTLDSALQSNYATGASVKVQVKVASTVTIQGLRTGAKNIPVAELSGILAGMAITISSGTRSETKCVIGTSSPGIVTVDSALQSSYVAGASVKAQVKIASTVSTQDMCAGAMTITVADVSQILGGMSITISSGTSSETKKVVGISNPGIVTVDSALQSNYVTGASVKAQATQIVDPPVVGVEDHRLMRTALLGTVGRSAAETQCSTPMKHSEAQTSASPMKDKSTQASPMLTDTRPAPVLRDTQTSPVFAEYRQRVDVKVDASVQVGAADLEDLSRSAAKEAADRAPEAADRARDEERAEDVDLEQVIDWARDEERAEAADLEQASYPSPRSAQQECIELQHELRRSKQELVMVQAKILDLQGRMEDQLDQLKDQNEHQQVELAQRTAELRQVREQLAVASSQPSGSKCCTIQ